jgi:hypothetical protein
MLFFRKQSARQPRRLVAQPRKRHRSSTSNNKDPSIPAESKLTIEAVLPQQADDNTVRRRVSSMFDSIELHVENFYREGIVPINPTTESELSRFGTPFLSKPIVAFLETTSRTRRLIKHCLAFHVISMTSTSMKNNKSLLPPEVSLMLNAIWTSRQQDDQGKCKCLRAGVSLKRNI